MGTKINQLIKTWKPGMVFTASFLKEQGINYDQQSTYKKSGWLESLGSGAFKHAGDTVSWPGAVHALQQQLNIKVHISAKSALYQHGYSHYVYPQENELYLNMHKDHKIPKWFTNCCKNISPQISRTALLPYDLEDSYTFKEINGFNVKISIPERAVLEMLFYIPQKQGFDEAEKMIEFLTTLRPEKVQFLLGQCRSVKVKRLFLYLAEKQNHPWLAELDHKKINLGSGKRVIIKNGMLDKKYLITVPGESKN